MTSKTLMILSMLLGIQSIFGQTLPEAVSLEEALAYG